MTPLHYRYRGNGVPSLVSITSRDITLYIVRRGIKTFVLDEADEMLSRGFKDQIYDVFRYMSNKIQVSLMTEWFEV